MKYIAIKCFDCGEINVFPSNSGDGRNCMNCGGHNMQPIGNVIFDRVHIGDGRKPAPKIMYLCDHRACEKCAHFGCEYTLDVRHAENFENRLGFYCEKSPSNER